MLSNIFPDDSCSYEIFPSFNSFSDHACSYKSFLFSPFFFKTHFTHALINLFLFYFSGHACSFNYLHACSYKSFLFLFLFSFLFFSFFLFFFISLITHALTKFFRSRMLLLIFSLFFFFFSFLITHALIIIFRSTHALINIFPFTISPITHALIIFFFFSKSSYITHAFINLFSLHNLFPYYACTYKYVHSFSIHF